MATAAPIRWGILGVGDVCEVKSGPGFQKAQGSKLVAVMRRSVDKAEDFAARHGASGFGAIRAFATAEELVAWEEVDAVYIATPPGPHCDLAKLVLAAKKPCLIEKPLARTAEESRLIVEVRRGRLRVR